MVRSLVTVGIVIALGGLLSHFEQSQGQREQIENRLDSSTWVRTVDGWEPPEVLQVTPRVEWTPSLHPALVAALQLGVSLFVLLAFPAPKSISERRSEQSSEPGWDLLAGFQLLRS